MKLVVFALCVAFAKFHNVFGAAVVKDIPTFTIPVVKGPSGYYGWAGFGAKGFKFDEYPPINQWDKKYPNGGFNYGYKNANGIQVNVSGHQEGTPDPCCPCQYGIVMEGKYSFVPLESNESGDEAVIDPGYEFTITWTAGPMGFKPIITKAPNSNKHGIDEAPPLFVITSGPTASGNFAYSYADPNGIKVEASGHLEDFGLKCCLCGVGTVMKGAYSYVPLDSNESGDELPVLSPKVRYVVHWTADTKGFQPVLSQHALSDYSYGTDELY